MVPPIRIAQADPGPHPCVEGEILGRMHAALERRLDQVIDELPMQIEAAVQRAMAAHTLTPEQRQWVELAIQREAQSIRLRQAIIEKTLAGLLWAALVAVGTLVYHGAADWISHTLTARGPRP